MPKGSIRNPGTAKTSKERSGKAANNLLDRYKNDKELRKSYDNRVKESLARNKAKRKAK